MKKVWMLAVCLILGIGAAMADERPVSVSDLPKGAQSFLKKYYPKEKSIAASIKSGKYATYYEVKFNNTEIEFTAEGEWKEVECKYSAVPEAIVPKNVAAAANEHFTNVPIAKIERDRRGFEIRLANGAKMTFDVKGNVVDIED
ncbi:MAG: PepSY-like domain-containing protein [Bacteroidales bacterium]|nr:PepSY-like domain-containing protein [Bacteroidales bacterium]MDE7090759.1 PepSY-like domain-containing protein [Bacteroidales bacterium]MDE7102652.1 PepSY-like domain-containing protein [Bacteroidales bacterium]